MVFFVAMIQKFTDQRGYTTYVDQETKTLIREHQLAALVDNDSHEVFAEETDIHHLIATPRNSKIKLDLPSTVCVVNKSKHRRLHATGYASVPIESVLDTESENQKESAES